MTIHPALHEDDALLVLDKPSGMPSLPLRDDEEGTAVHRALALCPALKGVGRDPREPGLLHRLDTGTSGLLVFCKTQEAFDTYARVWKERRVTKTYRALCLEAEPRPAETDLPLKLDWPLIRTLKGRRRMRALIPGRRVPAGSTRGKELEAITWIDAVKPMRTTTGLDLLDITVRIETGVMHQIRCHLEATGYPILGDTAYAPAEHPSSPATDAPKRLWLHAWRLDLPEVGDRPSLSLEASLPQGWPVAD